MQTNDDGNAATGAQRRQFFTIDDFSHAANEPQILCVHFLFSCNFLYVDPILNASLHSREDSDLWQLDNLSYLIEVLFVAYDNLRL